MIGQHAAFGEAVDALSDGLQRVNVQSGIGFVQKGHPWLEEQHLEDFQSLFRLH